MSYPLPNNPQGLKGDLVVAGSIRSSGAYAPSGSLVLADKLQSSGAASGLTLQANVGPVVSQPTIIPTTPATSVDRRVPGINPIFSTDYYVVASAPLTDNLLAAPKLKATFTYNLGTNDATNNSSYRMGWVKSVPIGQYSYDANYNFVQDALNLTTGLSLTANSVQGEFTLLLTKGVDYQTTDTSIGLAVGGTISYPNSRVSGGYVQVLIEPVF